MRSFVRVGFRNAAAHPGGKELPCLCFSCTVATSGYVAKHGHCVIHEQKCHIDEQSDIFICGFPCNALSQQNTKRFKFTDPFV